MGGGEREKKEEPHPPILTLPSELSFRRSKPKSAYPPWVLPGPWESAAGPLLSPLRKQGNRGGEEREKKKKKRLPYPFLSPFLAHPYQSSAAHRAARREEGKRKGKKKKNLSLQPISCLIVSRSPGNYLSFLAYLRGGRIWVSRKGEGGGREEKRGKTSNGDFTTFANANRRGTKAVRTGPAGTKGRRGGERGGGRVLLFQYTVDCCPLYLRSSDHLAGRVVRTLKGGRGEKRKGGKSPQTRLSVLARTSDPWAAL